ncbi:hypothetical protein ILUMI_20629 [Ignelater luminosus]|uniref:Baculoviral IAP repeat-containing protein 5 n=1 Tax=Ignelater luminosus TaxID=2038154 RepID=A0A8K0CH46_IGNLU|nr:hypothetical protein ILUMI_20629 [Ignelater luminosus]
MIVTPYDKFLFHVQLIFEEKRLKTFKEWPFDDDKPCSAQKLAEAGFYFAGSAADPDAVQCFLCDKALDGWDEEDDPWEEHLSHSENCEFAKLKQHEAALTYEQLTNFKKQLLIKSIKKCAEELKRDVDDLYNARLHKIKKFVRALKSRIAI